MKLSEFDYHLPQELIAQKPADKRECSKMMVLDRSYQAVEHKYFYEIVDLLTPNDLLVINNTKVIKARVFAKKDTGANIEIFILRAIDDTTWECLLKPSKRIKSATKLYLKNNFEVDVVDSIGDGKWIIKTPSEFETILNEVGNMPLPPYIKREEVDENQNLDNERYQTVYAKNPGAVAAPTAGLHFTPEIIQALKSKGVNIAEVTLHVGLGTFKPVMAENIEDHVMHQEYYHLAEESSNVINSYKSSGKRIIAVGTTSIRVLETISNGNNGKILPSSGWSDIFIYPGYKFKVIDGCITNFHLPGSTLLMLVSALAGKEFILDAYKKAIKHNYRFYSYGDCMFIT